jgi:hypothetical protein
VFRTVLETMRTLFVWLVDLLLFYTPLGLGKLGESWSAWSFMQAAGCAINAGLSLWQCPAQSLRRETAECHALLPVSLGELVMSCSAYSFM